MAVITGRNGGHDALHKPSWLDRPPVACQPTCWILLQLYSAKLPIGSFDHRSSASSSWVNAASEIDLELLIYSWGQCEGPS